MIFRIFILLFSVSLFSQKELSLSDAVLKRWTDFYPEGISNLEWQKTQDFYSYVKDDCLLIFNENNNLVDKVCLDELKSIQGISNFPNIKWVSNHSFQFEFENQFFLFNTKNIEKYFINTKVNFIKTFLKDIYL